jgi:hypothetical protein
VTATHYWSCRRLQCPSCPRRGQTQVVKVVGDELKVRAVDGLILGELDAKQADVASGNGGFM